MYIHRYIYIYTQLYIYLYIYMYIHSYIYVYIYISISLYIYMIIYIYTQLYVHTHNYTHICIQIYIYISSFSQVSGKSIFDGISSNHIMDYHGRSSIFLWDSIDKAQESKQQRVNYPCPAGNGRGPAKEWIPMIDWSIGWWVGQRVSQ